MRINKEGINDIGAMDALIRAMTESLLEASKRRTSEVVSDEPQQEPVPMTEKEMLEEVWNRR